MKRKRRDRIQYAAVNNLEALVTVSVYANTRRQDAKTNNIIRNLYPEMKKICLQLLLLLLIPMCDVFFFNR